MAPVPRGVLPSMMANTEPKRAKTITTPTRRPVTRLTAKLMPQAATMLQRVVVKKRLRAYLLRRSICPRELACP